MSKLIQKYKDNPSHKMLIKIAEYSKKHPFAWIMITQEEATFIKTELEKLQEVIALLVAFLEVSLNKPTQRSK